MGLRGGEKAWFLILGVRCLRVDRTDSNELQGVCQKLGTTETLLGRCVHAVCCGSGHLAVILAAVKDENRRTRMRSTTNGYSQMQQWPREAMPICCGPGHNRTKVQRFKA